MSKEQCKHKNFSGGYGYNFYFTTRCDDCGAVYDKDKKQWMIKKEDFEAKRA